MKKFFLLIFFLILNINNVFAATNIDDAKSFINNIAENVISIASDNQTNDFSKEEKLIELFKKSVDIDWIAKFSLGRYAETLTSSQKEQYNRAFEQLLIHTYVPNFKRYTNQSFKIINVISSSQGEYLVKTHITGNKEANNIRVDYAIKPDLQTKFKIFDIVAEGVSLKILKRDESNFVLNKHNIDFLINDINSKLKNL